MNVFKKLAILCSALLMTAALGAATACEKFAIDLPDSTTQSSESSSSQKDPSTSEGDTSPEDPEEPEIKDFVCRVKVQNATGYGFRGVTVALKDGDTVVAHKNTTSSGYATFQKHELTLGKYTIEVSLMTIFAPHFSQTTSVSTAGIRLGPPVFDAYSIYFARWL